MSTEAGAGRIEGGDIEEYNQIATPWQVLLRQMSRGVFHAEADYLSVNGILLYREHFNREAMVSGAAPEGFFTIGGPMTSSTHIDWCGTELSSQCLAFAAPFVELDFILPDESNHWALLIPQSLLLQHLDQGLPASGQFHGLRHMQVSHELGRALPNLVHGLIDKYLAHADLLADEQECQTLTSQLLETFETVVQSPPVDNTCGNRRKRRSALQRAIDYADSHERPVTVPDLATEAGVSQRVLELAFREYLDITPLTYLRWSRLNKAFCVFCAAEPGSIQITTIAAQLGFSDLGRFSGIYKQLFGELPSATLARKPRKPKKCLIDAVR